MKRWQICLGLAVVGAAVRLWLLSRDVPTLDSDEATFGLMALHLGRGEWTTFMWGQAYMGSLESLASLPFLWIFGVNAFALRLGPLVLALAVTVVLFLLVDWLYPRRVALWSALLFAVGSPFVTVLSIREFGGYIETLLFTLGLLWLALRGDRGRWWVAGFGLLIGVALWTDLLIGPALIGIGAILWWQRRGDLRGRNGAILAGGAILGALPAILANIASHGASLIVVSPISNAAHTHPTPLPLLFVQHLWYELVVSLPILAGGFVGGTQSSNYGPNDYLVAGGQQPIIYVIGLLIALSSLALALSAGRRAWQRRRILRKPLPKSALAQRRVQFEAALLIMGALYLAALALYRQENFAIPRYLFPLALLAPVCIGQLDRLLRWYSGPGIRGRLKPRLGGLRATKPACAGWGFSHRHNGGATGAINRAPTLLSPSPSPIGRGPGGGATVLLTLVLAPVLVWNVIGLAAVTPLQTAANDHGQWIYGRDAALLAVLQSHHVHTVISNDYWLGLRLTFESHEQIRNVLVQLSGKTGFNRYQPYVTAGLADPRPAYLEITGTPEAARRDQQAQAGMFPQYTRVQVGIFTVYVPR